MYNNQRSHPPKVKKFHLTYRIPYVVNFPNPSECIIVNDQYHFERKCGLASGTWKLTLIKNENDEIDLLVDSLTN